MNAEELAELDTDLALLATTVSRARLHLQKGDLDLVKIDLNSIESECRMLKSGLPEPEIYTSRR